MMRGQPIDRDGAEPLILAGEFLLASLVPGADHARMLFNEDNGNVVEGAPIHGAVYVFRGQMAERVEKLLEQAGIFPVPNYDDGTVVQQ